MNWTPGPARCRSPEYEAEIAFTDMGDDRPLLGRVRGKGGTQWVDVRWHENGMVDGVELCDDDLMPQTITREALAEEILRMHGASRSELARNQAMQMIAHVIDAVKSGRVGVINGRD